MSFPDYLDIPVELDDGTILSAAAVLEESHRAVAAGQSDVGAHLFLLACNAVLEAGLAPELERLMAQFGSLFSDEILPAATRAWFMHIEGAMHSRFGEPKEARELFEGVRRLAEDAGDRDLSALASFNLANQDFYEGKLDQAAHLYRAAFDAWHDLGDYYGAVRALQNIAAVSLSREDLEQTGAILEATEHVLPLVPAEPHLRFSESLLKAQLAVKTHQLEDAAAEFQRALRYARQTSDALAECVAIQNLGAIYADLGEHSRAIRWLRKGIRLAESISAKHELGLLQSTLAIAMIGTHRLREAQEAFEKARSIFDQLGDTQKLGTVTADLGTLAIQRGEFKDGRLLLAEALQLAQQEKSDPGQVLALRNLLLADILEPDPESAETRANALLQLLPPDATDQRADTLSKAAEAALNAKPPQFERAYALFEQGLAEFGQLLGIDGPQNLNTERANFTVRCAAHLSQHGGSTYAISFYDRALAAYEAAGDQEMAFHVRNDRAIALTEAERYEEARTEYLICLDQAAHMENRAMELQALFNLGEMDHRDGRLDEAVTHLQRAVELARELEDIGMELDAQNSLGIAHLKAESFEQAREAFGAVEPLARRDNNCSALAGALGGLAGVAFANREFRQSSRLYGQAADIEIKERDWRHAAEDLAGQLQALAELGRRSEFDRHVQALVDVAQGHFLSPLVGESFLRCGLTWLVKGRIEAATDSYALALALILNHYGSDEATGVQKFAETITAIAAPAYRSLGPNTDVFYRHLIDSMNHLHPELGDLFQPMIDDSRRIVEQQLEHMSDMEN